MEKRIIYIVVLFALGNHAALSQSKAPKYYHWSFGISSGDILHNLFNTVDTNRSYAAFVLEYAGKKYAVQAGFRPGYNLNDTKHEGFSDTEITEVLSFSQHLNFTRTIFGDHRWTVRAGLKYQGGWSREDITKDSGFDRVVTRRLQWNAGVGPVVDLRFMVHPRISLGTEASLLYIYSDSELQQRFTNFPDFDTTMDKITSHKMEVSEPMTIYLRFHF
ncbi:MAG: hypothetical protein ABIQ02_14790 [Saprospiraceae bacterium]